MYNQLGVDQNVQTHAMGQIQKERRYARLLKTIMTAFSEIVTTMMASTYCQIKHIAMSSSLRLLNRKERCANGIEWLVITQYYCQNSCDNKKKLMDYFESAKADDLMRSTIQTCVVDVA